MIPMMHLLGPFPLWGKVGMGAFPAPNPAGVDPAVGVFQPLPGRADS